MKRSLTTTRCKIFSHPYTTTISNDFPFNNKGRFLVVKNVAYSDDVLQMKVVVMESTK